MTGDRARGATSAILPQLFAGGWNTHPFGITGLIC